MKSVVEFDQSAVVDASTRRRVAAAILRSGPSTAAALAKRLNLTPAAIRRQLATLIERGLVGSRDERVYGSRGRGRPAKVFFLTDAGRAEFYQAYDELAIDALNALAAVGGREAIARLAEQRFSAVEREFERQSAEHPGWSKLQSLTAALDAEGYVASVVPARLGSQLCQHHCPIAHVAEHYPELCEVETRGVSRLLGTNVQRLATIAHGDGVCTTHVPDPQRMTEQSSGAPRPAGALRPRDAIRTAVNAKGSQQ